MYLSWISTTTVLVVIALVMVVRSVKTLDRRRHPVVEAQAWAVDITEDTEPVFPRDHVLLRRRTEMISTPSPRSDAPGQDPDGSAGAAPAFRSAPVPRRSPRRTTPSDQSAGAAGTIRWGRTAVALVGVAALALAVVTALLAPFTAVSWTLPLFCLVVGAGALASLRYLAVRERAERRRARSEAPDRSTAPAPAADGEEARSLRVAALATEPESAEEIPSAETQTSAADRAGESAARSDVVPDAEPVAPESPSPSAVADRPEPSASSAQTGTAPADPEDDFAGLDVASLGGRSDEEVPSTLGEEGTAPQSPAGHGRSVRGLDEAPGVEMLREQARRAAAKPVAFTPRTSSWSPVEVPRPTYADAPKAERRAPEPLQAPEQPRSTSKTVFEAAARGESVNLDDVLTRRRRA